jgi:uncharacterized protein (DUF39 family)
LCGAGAFIHFHYSSDESNIRPLQIFLEPIKKYCGRAERGFLILGEALAKEHVRSDLRLSRNEAKNQKDRSVNGFHSMATGFL